MDGLSIDFRHHHQKEHDIFIRILITRSHVSRYRNVISCLLQPCRRTLTFINCGARKAYPSMYMAPCLQAMHSFIVLPTERYFTSNAFELQVRSVYQRHYD